VNQSNIAEWAEKTAISETLHRYSNAVTSRDEAEIRAVFMPTASWSVGPPFNRTLTGNAVIAAGIVEGIASFAAIVQMVHSIVITVKSDYATAHSLIHEYARASSGKIVIQNVGFYDDELFRDTHHWRFAKRMFTVVDVELETPS